MPRRFCPRALSDGAVLRPDSDGPEMIVAREFLETKRGMRRIFHEGAISRADAARTVGSS